MGKYFINVNTLEQLRRQYKELLKKYHPDNGGSEEIMKAVNVEYDKLFKVHRKTVMKAMQWTVTRIQQTMQSQIITLICMTGRMTEH